MHLRDLFRRSGAAPLDPSFGLLLGDLEGPVARIDRAGTFATLDRSWRIEWGVGVGAQWRVAGRERAVRQTRVDDTPVFETRLRVPGGDVIQRVGVVNDGRARAVVVEYENASPEAVVIATAGFTEGPLRTGERGVALGDVAWIVPERPGTATVATDIWETVAADPPTGLEAHGRGAAAVLTALPHRQSVTVAVVLAGPPPGRAPTPAEIATGWRAVTAPALSVKVPDIDLTRAWRRVVCDLVLAAGDDAPIPAAEAAWWLDLAGLHDEADRGRVSALEAIDGGPVDASLAIAVLRSLASKELRAGEPSPLAEVAGPLAAAAGDRLDRVTVGLVARALDRYAPAAAADAQRLLVDSSVADRVPESMAAAGAASVLGRLFDDVETTGGLSMLPVVPPAWLGHPVDVRGLVTGVGRLSFSVRWHGPRPALLWEREGGPDEILLRCRGLDPSWSSGERSGEALLAAP